jgi:excisionase family DNA binding protein
MDANHHASEANDFVTVAEVEKRCRVTRATVEGWIESGELPHYRLGPRTIRIALADLEEFLTARRYAGLPPGLRNTTDELPSDARKSRTTTAAEDIRSRCSSPAEEVGDSRTAAA